MERKSPRPLELIYCYARKDRALRDELDIHLAGLRRSNLITAWYDGAISPGTVWEQAIATHLNTAHIILLLVSSDFIGSDYCYSKEMTRAIERHQREEARVIPVLLRSSDWINTPLRELQVLPSNAEPVTRWPDHDEAFYDIVKGIRQAVRELLKSQGNDDGVPPPVPSASVNHFSKPLREASQRWRFLQKPTIVLGMMSLLVLLPIILILVVPAIQSSILHRPSATTTDQGHNPSLTLRQMPNAPVHLQELNPYCGGNDEANWKVFNPQASCSNPPSGLTMHQTIYAYSEIDLLTVGGSSYNLTDFRVTVQAILQGENDGETYAALVVQTPAGTLPTSNDGGYVVAVTPTGTWRLQHIPAAGDLQLIQASSIPSLDPDRLVTIGIIGKNGVLNLYIYQGNASTDLGGSK